MVVAKGPQYCVIDGQFIVGNTHLVSPHVEANCELPDDAEKGPCCNRHYMQFFYNRPSKSPTVRTLLMLENDIIWVELLNRDLLVTNISVRCWWHTCNPKSVGCFINTEIRCFKRHSLPTSVLFHSVVNCLSKKNQTCCFTNCV